MRLTGEVAMIARVRRFIRRQMPQNESEAAGYLLIGAILLFVGSLVLGIFGHWLFFKVLVLAFGLLVLGVFCDAIVDAIPGRRGEREAR
jgi:hypothetical protein